MITQSGLGMPDRDYYLSGDVRLKGIREKYQVYVKDLLAAAGTPKADSVADKIVAIETQLAKSHWTRVQNRDAQKTYNRLRSRGAAQADAGLRLERVLRRRADPGGQDARRWWSCSRVISKRSAS